VVPLNWIGSSKKDLLGMPNEVRQVAGYGLYLAQAGRNHPDAGPFDRRFGAKVLKIRIDYQGDTYRIVYTPALANSICVLHAFKKKSTRGKATPKRDIERVEERFRLAEEQHRAGRLPSQRSAKRRE
jgi:phage-related protein